VFRSFYLYCISREHS